jgi:hypothetical protein
MLEVNYRRLEKTVVILIFVGILAMFQPWFSNLVELFEPLLPEARVGRTFHNEIAPIIFRYGFYATFLSTVAFIVISHYTPKDLRYAFQTKGVALTLLLIILPVFYGFMLLGNLAWAYYTAALLGVVNFVCAIATWNWKRWGPIGLTLSALAELGLALSGSASIPMAMAILIALVALIGLIWPKRAALK